MIALALFSLLPLLSEPPTSAAVQDEKNSWTVYADMVYTANGDPIEGGLVTIRDGKIASVSKGRRPGGDDALRVAAITPGMVDLSARAHGGLSSVEQSNEIQPHRSVVEAIDMFSTAWDSHVRAGVTTAMVNPLDRNVIGGLGVILKTAGPHTVEGRMVKKDAALRGAIGAEPSRGNHPAFGSATDFYSRRPTTRMGVEWEWRKAFYDAAQREGEKQPGDDQIKSVLAGRLPLFVQAWTTQDIRTAVFLKEEMQAQGFGTLNLIIDAGAESWKEPQLLKRTGSSVVLPPFPTGAFRSGDGAFMTWSVAKTLHDEGIPFALSAHGRTDLNGRLGAQAGMAMHGGLPLSAAIEAVTITPARLMGVDNRVGSLEVGKDADLVLWSGPVPFDRQSQVVGVLVDGVLKLDPRN